MEFFQLANWPVEQVEQQVCLLPEGILTAGAVTNLTAPLITGKKAALITGKKKAHKCTNSVIMVIGNKLCADKKQNIFTLKPTGGS